MQFANKRNSPERKALTERLINKCLIQICITGFHLLLQNTIFHKIRPNNNIKKKPALTPCIVSHIMKKKKDNYHMWARICGGNPDMRNKFFA